MSNLHLKALACAIIFTFVNNAAQATTIVSISGGDGSSGINFSTTSTHEVVAVEFTTANAYTDASIYGEFSCISCIGDVGLYTTIGGSAGIGDLVTGYSFDTPGGDTFGTFAGEYQVFSGLNLAADTYYMVIGLVSGTLGWRTATSPVLTQNDGGTVGFDYGSGTRSASGSYKSTFELLFNSANRLQYRVDATVTSTPSEVPLPAGIWMLLVSLTGLGTLRVRRNFKGRP